jgi:hypothetical protein
MDIDSSPAADSGETIRDILAKVDTILVVIGPWWENARTVSGNRYLDNPEDLVRLEIAAALRSGKRTIPVLVGGAAFPDFASLPADIRELAYRNAIQLTDDRWADDTARLMDTLHDIVTRQSNLPIRTSVSPAPHPEIQKQPPRTPPAQTAHTPSQMRHDGFAEDARDIFISYVEEDGVIAATLADELRKQQLSTWTYEEDGVPGISYLAQVFQAIEACQAFVLVASATSVKARQVIREVEAAHERDKMIIPVRVGLTHDQFTASNSILRMATGTAVSSSLDGRDTADIANRIANAIRRAGRTRQ